jgi:hydrogenase maturation protease
MTPPTVRLPARAARPRRVDGSAARPSRERPIPVEILACGAPDRGDDAVGLVVAEALRTSMPAGARVRVVGQLDVDDLLAVPAGGAVIVVDAATGVRGGHIVELPLSGLIGRDDRLRPRSSHALEFREVIGVADMIRGHPLDGRIVAVGGVRFSLGAGLSPSVVRAVPRMVAAIRDAVARLRA